MLKSLSIESGSTELVQLVAAVILLLIKEKHDFK